MSTYVMVVFRIARASAGAIVVAIFASAFVTLALATHLTGIAIQALAVGRELSERALEPADSEAPNGTAAPKAATHHPAIPFDSPELVPA